ncbi:MAG: hypothetical protein K6A89_04270 [Treponema sp.]|nr:hypothetical protein [Treponema sp.]
MSENVLPEENSENKESQIPQPPRQEHPVAGRKVFFVNPPLYVENYLHLELKQHEYEVYIIPDYRYTKVALRNFPDALCFIFIDDGLSFDEWFNFVKSFQFEDVLKTIFIGLMSAVIPAQVKEKFMLNLSLPGGFIMLNECKGSMLIEKIVGILDFNGAKGRRKYIRLDCEDDVSINGYFANKSQLYQVTIVNISSVGFACYYPKSYGEALIKNSYVPSFSVTLGRRSIVTPSIVFDTRPYDEDRLFSVLLFVKQVGEDDRKVIKNFIFEQLQNRFENSVFSLPLDMEDYSNRNPKFSKKDLQGGAQTPSENSGENEEKPDQEVKELPEYIEENKNEDSGNGEEAVKMTGTSYDHPEISEEL